MQLSLQKLIDMIYVHTHRTRLDDTCLDWHVYKLVAFHGRGGLIVNTNCLQFEKINEFLPDDSAIINF